MGKPICGICGAMQSIGGYKIEGHAVCEKSECRSKIHGLMRSQVTKWCEACNIHILSPTSGGINLCGEPSCKQLITFRIDEELKTKRAERANNHHQKLHAMIQQEIGENAVGQHIVVVPYNDRKYVPLPQNRIEEFVANLRQLAQRVTEEDDSEDNLYPKEFSLKKVLPMADAQQESRFNRLNMEACSMCGGKCCQSGGTHAYLKPTNMKAAMAQAEESNYDSVIELYVSYLPELAYEDACVYHTRTGCALPRDLRSNICNTYLCPTLNEIVEIVAKDTRPLTFGATNVRFPDDTPKVYATKAIEG